MDTIWSPWRLDYILSDKSTGCVFCSLPAANDDVDNLILWRGKTCYVIVNRFPYNGGHLMVVPFAHGESLPGLPRETQTELIWLTGECVSILKNAIGAHGCNCGMNLGRDAGGGIQDHLHMHVVPRWRGDNNFFPVIANTKAMPEYLAKTYAKLKPSFEKLNRVE